jgi:hypothetical protein
MKLAIIEDRISRLENFLDSASINDANVEVVSGRGFDLLVQQLEGGEASSLDGFNCVACHRSALKMDLREVIKGHCRSAQKLLIFFSGGISSSFYDDTLFPFLSINSKDFYSSRLRLFINELKQENVNPLILQFGEQWKLSLFLQLRNRLALFQNRKENVRMNDLKISSSIKHDLTNQETAHMFDKGDFTKINSEQLTMLKGVLDKKIKTFV